MNPPDYRDDPASWMLSGYRECYGTGLLGRGWNLAHSLIERPFQDSHHFNLVLELGAGHGQHFPHVRHSFGQYLMTDLMPELLPVAHDGRVNTMGLDAADLRPIASESVDRLIATCLLAHMNDPLAALQEWRRVVRPGGYLSLYVPLEPSIANLLVRKAYIWPRSRRHGAVDPEYLMWSQHMIHYPALRVFLNLAFAKDSVETRRFPSKFVPWNLGIFEVWTIQVSGAESSSTG